MKTLLLTVVAVAGCKDPDELKVVQRTQVPSHGVQIYVGDIELGRHAEIKVTAPNGDVLGNGNLEVGEELPFHFGGKPYVVRAKRYEDHTLHEDIAFLRVDQRAWTAHSDTVEIAENASGVVPGRPDAKINVGVIELNRSVFVTVSRPNNLDMRQELSLGDSMHVESAHAEYSLALVAVAFEPSGVDHAYFHVRPGPEH